MNNKEVEAIDGRTIFLEEGQRYLGTLPWGIDLVEGWSKAVREGGVRVVTLEEMKESLEVKP